MASYNTVPAAEEPLLQKPTKSNRKFIVAGVAAAMFFLGALASGPIASKFESTGTTNLVGSTGTCIPKPVGAANPTNDDGSYLLETGRCKMTWTHEANGMDDAFGNCATTQRGCSNCGGWDVHS